MSWSHNHRKLPYWSILIHISYCLISFQYHDHWSAWDMRGPRRCQTLWALCQIFSDTANVVGPNYPWQRVWNLWKHLDVVNSDGTCGARIAPLNEAWGIGDPPAPTLRDSPVPVLVQLVQVVQVAVLPQPAPAAPVSKPLEAPMAPQPLTSPWPAKAWRWAKVSWSHEGTRKFKARSSPSAVQ